jgi:cytochrome b
MVVFGFIVMTTLIVLLSYGIYQRFQAEKQTIQCFLELDQAGLKYVKKLMKSPRIEKCDVEPKDALIIALMHSHDWLSLHPDGALVRTGKTGYFARRLGVDV